MGVFGESMGVGLKIWGKTNRRWTQMDVNEEKNHWESGSFA
jgi:hypothetical protein